jgi:transglutaminase-like putative cysteine protease
VGCALTWTVETPADIAFQVAVARRPGRVVQDRLDVLNNGVALTPREVAAPDQGQQHLVRAEPGRLTVSYQAAYADSGSVVAQPVTDEQRIVGLRPSRYCPSDRLAGFAQSRFADPSAVDRVRAICEHVWRHIGYEAGVTGSAGDAIDTLLAGRGVCRDFAHLVIALCRAVDVPARMAAVYAPGLSPMDFHAVVETAIDGRWWTWDATRLSPRSTLVRIATGRDAADIAFATVLDGRAELSHVEIEAAAPHDLPLDDHEQLVALT